MREGTNQMVAPIGEIKTVIFQSFTALAITSIS